MSMSFSRRPAWGLGLSLLAHVTAVAWLARLAPPRPAPEAPASTMQVTLLRLPPPHVDTPATPVPLPPSPPRTRTARPAAAAVHAAPAPAQPSTEEAPQIVLAPEDEAVAAVGAPAQAAAGFDLQAARGAARTWVKGEGAGRGGADGKGKPLRSVRDEKFGEAVERARPADCRGAYAGLGLLAVIPLAASAVTGKGCKW